jgi:hypothetical protein
MEHEIITYLQGVHKAEHSEQRVFQRNWLCMLFIGYLIIKNAEQFRPMENSV